MTDIETMAEIMKRINKKYEKDPEKWKVVGGVDQDGNHDMFIHQDPVTYWVKSKQISPNQYLSMGSEMTNIDMEINKKINKENGKKSEDLLRMFGMAVPTDQQNMIVASGLEHFSQPVSNQIKNNIDEKIPNFARNLNKEIEDLYRKKFSMRSGMFI